MNEGSVIADYASASFVAICASLLESPGHLNFSPTKIFSVNRFVFTHPSKCCSVNRFVFTHPSKCFK